MCGRGIIGLFDAIDGTSLQLPVECAAWSLYSFRVSQKTKEETEGDISVLTSFPILVVKTGKAAVCSHLHFYQADTRHSKPWSVPFTAGRGSRTCEANPTPGHASKGGKWKEIHSWVPKWAEWCTATHRDQCQPELFVWKQKSSYSTGKHCCVCVIIKLTTFPCSSTELVPKMERNDCFRYVDKNSKTDIFQLFCFSTMIKSHIVLLPMDSAK